jgi:glycerol-3-phosphate dehydrogenase
VKSLLFVIVSFSERGARDWVRAKKRSRGEKQLRSVAADKANALYDIAVIGGGINGCGIARDAAGRGWSVFLCEKGDLASATSSASTKLIHGGLRYLEYYQFRLVREALMERETLWRIAPHIVWPLRFVLPHHKGLRPAWLLRLGLFLYDHLGGRKLLPPTRTLRLRNDVSGEPLKPEFTLGFEYSDCWVEDSRLVALNARDAANLGAIIAPRFRCMNGERQDGVWMLSMRDELSGEISQIKARTLVNAAGPWVGDVLALALRNDTPESVRLVKGSHIVVPKLYRHDRCYIFQNADRRVFFAIPYQHDFTLIGTTDLDYVGDPAAAAASDDEIAYLCTAASDYFKAPVTSDRVVWSYSGVRPLYDDGASEAQAATRDYVLKLDAPPDGPALLSVFGGKITTYRRLAESALALLTPYLPAARRAEGWTGKAPLPGGDFPVQGFAAQVKAIQTRYPFLEPALTLRLVRAYGALVPEILGNAKSPADLGRIFGADLTEAEVRYLAHREWAMTADDIVWRRSKLGLRLSKAQIVEIDDYLKVLPAAREAAE